MSCEIQQTRNNILNLLSEKSDKQYTPREIFKSSNKLLLTEIGFETIKKFIPEIEFYSIEFNRHLSVAEILKLKKLNHNVYWISNKTSTLYTSCFQFMALTKLTSVEDIFNII